MKKLLLTTAICFAATSAAAEITYGMAFAKFHSLDDDGGDENLRTFGGGIEYRTNSFTFSGEIGRIDAGGDDLDLASVGFGYKLQNGVTFGLDHAEFDVGDADAGVTSLYASYGFSDYTLGLSIGESSDIDDTVYGVFGAWDVTPTGTVGLDYVSVDGESLTAAYVDYDLDRYNVQADVLLFDGVDVYSVAGSYDLGNRFSVIGSLSAFDFDGLDANAITVGVQYEIAEGANAELALGRISADEGDVDLMTFGLSYEMGRRTNKRRTIGNILTSATGSIAGLTDF